MPLYDVICAVCGNKQEIYRKLDEYDKMPDCCSKPMRKVFLPTQVMPDIQPYKSMVTGEMITSRSHHKRHLKEHNLNEIGNEPMENLVNRNKKGWMQEHRDRYDLRKFIYDKMAEKGYG